MRNYSLPPGIEIGNSPHFARGDAKVVHASDVIYLREIYIEARLVDLAPILPMTIQKLDHLVDISK